MNQFLPNIPILPNIPNIEKHIAQAVWCGPSGICVVDKDGRIAAVNEHMCRILNYTEKEIVGKHFNEFTLSRDQNVDLAEFQSLIEGKKAYYHMDKTWIGKLNTPVSGHLYAMRFDENEVIFAVSQVIEGLSPEHAISFAVLVRSLMEDWLLTQGLEMKKKDSSLDKIDKVWYKNPIVWTAIAASATAWPVLKSIIRAVLDSD
jgi:PAS domain S-box-containing protein